jgi:hypothetical protein
MLQTLYGDEAWSCSIVFELFQRFKDGRENLQDDPSASRNAERIASVREVVTWGRWWDLRMVTDELNISKETIRQILREDFRKR